MCQIAKNAADAVQSRYWRGVYWKHRDHIEISDIADTWKSGAFSDIRVPQTRMMRDDVPYVV
jgi:hypothetical protein